MRVFQDEAGREWEVIVGRESWGTVVALFLIRREPGAPRQTYLEVRSVDEGNRLLSGLNVEGLRSLLADSVPKPSAS